MRNTRWMYRVTLLMQIYDISWEMREMWDECHGMRVRGTEKLSCCQNGSGSEEGEASHTFWGVEVWLKRSLGRFRKTDGLMIWEEVPENLLLHATWFKHGDFCPICSCRYPNKYLLAQLIDPQKWFFGNPGWMIDIRNSIQFATKSPRRRVNLMSWSSSSCKVLYIWRCRRMVTGEIGNDVIQGRLWWM